MPATELETESSQSSDLQRRAYRALNEDGIVDVALGLGLLFGAFHIGFRHLGGVHVTGWSGLFPIFVMLVARGLRKRYVYPRIGYARARNASPAILLMATMTALLVAGLVVMTIYVRRGVRPPAGLMPWLLRLFALAGAATLALMGRRTGLARFYIHAGVVLIAALISVAATNTHYSLVLMFGLPGLFLFFTGLVCFFRFVQRHPKPESAHANP
jgi:hypothetical protein